MVRTPATLEVGQAWNQGKTNTTEQQQPSDIARTGATSNVLSVTPVKAACLASQSGTCGAISNFPAKTD
jgi:hypothetical protein